MTYFIPATTQNINTQPFQQLLKQLWFLIVVFSPPKNPKSNQNIIVWYGKGSDPLNWSSCSVPIHRCRFSSSALHARCFRLKWIYCKHTYFLDTQHQAERLSIIMKYPFTEKSASWRATQKIWKTCEIFWAPHWTDTRPQLQKDLVVKSLWRF